MPRHRLILIIVFAAVVMLFLPTVKSFAITYGAWYHMLPEHRDYPFTQIDCYQDNTCPPKAECKEIMTNWNQTGCRDGIHHMCVFTCKKNSDCSSDHPYCLTQTPMCCGKGCKPDSSKRYGVCMDYCEEGSCPSGNHCINEKGFAKPKCVPGIQLCSAAANKTFSSAESTYNSAQGSWKNAQDAYTKAKSTYTSGMKSCASKKGNAQASCKSSAASASSVALQQYNAKRTAWRNAQRTYSDAKDAQTKAVKACKDRYKGYPPGWGD
jgi:hypothetical protein